MESFLDQLSLLQVAAAIFVVVGLILAAFGGKLLKTGSAVSGLLIGGFGGWALALQWIENPDQQLFAVGGGALLGCLITYLLFRVWMGISCMIILGLTVPLSMMAWQNKSLDFAEDQSIISTVTQPQAFESAADFTMRQAQGNRFSGEDLRATAGVAKEHAQEVASWIQEFAKGRWEGLTDMQRQSLGMAGGAGALVGLLLGLLLPKIAAGVQSSMVGAVLILMGGYELLKLYDPQRASELIQTPRRVFIALLGISCLALIFQWTSMMRKTDS